MKSSATAIFRDLQRAKAKRRRAAERSLGRLVQMVPRQSKSRAAQLVRGHRGAATKTATRWRKRTNTGRASFTTYIAAIAVTSSSAVPIALA